MDRDNREIVYQYKQNIRRSGYFGRAKKTVEIRRPPGGEDFRGKTATIRGRTDIRETRGIGREKGRSRDSGKVGPAAGQLGFFGFWRKIRKKNAADRLTRIVVLVLKRVAAELRSLVWRTVYKVIGHDLSLPPVYKSRIPDSKTLIVFARAGKAEIAVTFNRFGRSGPERRDCPTSQTRIISASRNAAHNEVPQAWTLRVHLSIFLRGSAHDRRHRTRAEFRAREGESPVS
ncbi:unnamed protein product [Nesidiocoris tenuis]|uniref:Uncharacterized protein n=1 Tax=Nesidiocoris tenuis TaxID=355587 RepID=A0A6H5H7R3_9HEMI|nr:unnamed protein product [Nesidiocoris tenuis]